MRWHMASWAEDYRQGTPGRVAAQTPERALRGPSRSGPGKKKKKKNEAALCSLARIDATGSRVFGGHRPKRIPPSPATAKEEFVAYSTRDVYGSVVILPPLARNETSGAVRPASAIRSGWKADSGWVRMTAPRPRYGRLPHPACR